ncbi:MAG TPA: glycosyltransferase family 39 protein [Aggregatilineales bacterium]|nr:glycosyltransferase family 39 protein [Aggregatilineales bacterium]
MSFVSKYTTLLFFVALACLYALTYRGNIDVIDEAMMMGVTSQVAQAQTIQINAIYPALLPWGAPADDPSGPIYSKYAPGQSLLALPLFALGNLIPVHTLKTLNGQPFVPLAPFFVALLLNLLATLLTALAIFRIVPLWGYSRRTAALTCILYGATTLAWPYAKTFYSEPTTACALVWMVYFAIRCHQGRQRHEANAIRDGLLAGGALGLAILLRTTSVIFIPLLILYLLPDRWAMSATFPGIGIGGLLTVAYNYVRFGSLAESGYEPGFGRAPWEAWLGFLISPSRSLFLFNPVLLLAIPGAWWLAKRARRDVLLIAALILAQVGIYGAWWAWDGGQSLGPRFLIPAIPLAALLVAPVIERPRWRPILIALAVVGFAVQVLSNLANPNDVFYETVNRQGLSLSDVNWQFSASIPANLWTAYTRHDIDSLILRYLPPHDPVLKAVLFLILGGALVAAMLWLAGRFSEEGDRENERGAVAVTAPLEVEPGD